MAPWSDIKFYCYYLQCPGKITSTWHIPLDIYLGRCVILCALKDLLKSNSPWLKKLKEAKNPVVLVGPGILHRSDRGTILRQVLPTSLCICLYSDQLSIVQYAMS